jgi:cytochrome P450
MTVTVEHLRLSENELVAMAFLLLVAGHETTVNLIASGTLALLLNPGELARLRAEPSLIGGAVEELLRYVNPVNHATYLFAVEPVEIGGARIGRGDVVIVALSSANRDPSRYADPDRLDPGRETSGHLAFGHGIHYCVGAPLARLEAEIAFSHLLARYGSMRLAVPAESLRWRPSTLIHGLESLPVRLFPAERSPPSALSILALSAVPGAITPGTADTSPSPIQQAARVLAFACAELVARCAAASGSGSPA